MNNSPFQRIFLPSVLVSTAVFSALAFTFVLRRPEPLKTEFLPSESRIDQLLSDEYKGSVIRYVGFTIIASVSSGVITAEVLRKSRVWREALQTKKPQVSLEKLLQVKEPQVELPSLETEQAIDLSNQILELEAAEQFIELEPDLDTSIESLIQKASEQAAADANNDEGDIEYSSLFQFQPLSQVLIDKSDWLSPFQDNHFQDNHFQDNHFQDNHFQDNHSDKLAAATQLLCTLPKPQTHTSNPVLELTQDYHTCRVKVPFSQGRRFAVAHDGQYYSFIRLEQDRDQALASANQVARHNNQVAITQVKNGYAIWLLEPDAYQS